MLLSLVFNSHLSVGLQGNIMSCKLYYDIYFYESDNFNLKQQNQDPELLFLIILCPNNIIAIIENEVMCGHRLYFNNVSWYTAYETCNLNKKVLALPDTDLSSLIILLDDILKGRFREV